MLLGSCRQSVLTRKSVVRSYASLFCSSFVVLNGLVIEHLHSLILCQWVPTVGLVRNKFEIFVNLFPFLLVPVSCTTAFEVLAFVLGRFTFDGVAVHAGSAARSLWWPVICFPLDLDFAAALRIFVRYTNNRAAYK